jgi:hypothetical protein
MYTRGIWYIKYKKLKINLNIFKITKYVFIYLLLYHLNSSYEDNK